MALMVIIFAMALIGVMAKRAVMAMMAMIATRYRFFFIGCKGYDCSYDPW